MIEDIKLKTQLSSNARQMIASRYEESFVHDCLIEYYHQILRKEVEEVTKKPK